jgi:hypothetical protein
MKCCAVAGNLARIVIKKHLHRYLAEFDFRHNNRIGLGVDDTARAGELAKGIVGKRLTYRRPRQQDAPF